MKHEHVLEVKVPPDLQEKIDANGGLFMLGLGVVLGAVGMRIFAKPTVKIIVIQPNA